MEANAVPAGAPPVQQRNSGASLGGGSPLCPDPVRWATDSGCRVGRATAVRSGGLVTLAEFPEETMSEGV